MSYFYDQKADLAIYEAPKNGGTTLRLWIAYKLTGRLFLSGPTTAYYTGTTEMTELLLDCGYRHHAFAPLDCRHRICIKRDPIERFLSCYHDKVINEERLTCSLSEFLDRFDEFLSRDKRIDAKYGMGKLAFHFQPQTYHFGTDPAYYDRIFSLDEVASGLKDYLEGMWNIHLPAIHARYAGDTRRNLTITKEEQNRIRMLYQTDYDNGWC